MTAFFHLYRQQKRWAQQEKGGGSLAVFSRRMIRRHPVPRKLWKTCWQGAFWRVTRHHWSSIALQTLGCSSFMKTLGSDIFFLQSFFCCLLLVQCKHGEAVFCLSCSLHEQSKQPVPCTGQQKQPQIGIVGTHPCMHHAVWQVFFSKHFSWLKSCHRIRGFLKIRHYLSVPDLADNGCKMLQGWISSAARTVLRGRWRIIS